MRGVTPLNFLPLKKAHRIVVTITILLRVLAIVRVHFAYLNLQKILKIPNSILTSPWLTTVEKSGTKSVHSLGSVGTKGRFVQAFS